MNQRHYRSVSFEPLEREVLRRGAVTAVLGLRTPAHRNWYRCKNLGLVRLRSAENFADTLGMHPSEIWGNEYWDLVA